MSFQNKKHDFMAHYIGYEEWNYDTGYILARFFQKPSTLQ